MGRLFLCFCRFCSRAFGRHPPWRPARCPGGRHTDYRFVTSSPTRPTTRNFSRHVAVNRVHTGRRPRRSFDLDKPAFERAVQEFGERLWMPMSAFLLRRARHQVRAANYLIPIDAT